MNKAESDLMAIIESHLDQDPILNINKNIRVLEDKCIVEPLNLLLDQGGLNSLPEEEISSLYWDNIRPAIIGAGPASGINTTKYLSQLFYLEKMMIRNDLLPEHHVARLQGRFQLTVDFAYDLDQLERLKQKSWADAEKYKAKPLFTNSDRGRITELISSHPIRGEMKNKNWLDPEDDIHYFRFYLLLAFFAPKAGIKAEEQAFNDLAAYEKNNLLSISQYRSWRLTKNNENGWERRRSDN